MSDIKIYSTAASMPDTPLTGDVVICSEAFNSAPASSVHLCTNATGPVWKSFANDAAVEAGPFSQYSLSFDGTDYLSLGNLSTFNSASSLSMSVWLNLSNWSGYEVYAFFTSGTSTSDRVSFYLNSVQELRFGVDSSVNNCTFNLSSPVDYRSSGWHHIAGTYNGTDVKLFFDGSQVATTTSGVPASTSSTAGNNAMLGGETWSNSRYFSGNIDDVAIFDTELSSTDISNIYGSGKPESVSSFDPKGWWRMGDDSNDTFVDGGSVASITDSSGNGNTATQATASSQPTFSTDVPS